MVTALQGDRCTNCNSTGTIIVAMGGLLAEVDCPKCCGTGIVNSPNACTKCKGNGNVIVDFGDMKVEATCDHCNGSGLEPN